MMNTKWSAGLITVLLVLVSNMAFSATGVPIVSANPLADKGLYLDFTAGMGDNGFSGFKKNRGYILDGDTLGVADFKSQVPATRIALGADLSKHLAVEFGYNYFFNGKYRLVDPTNANDTLEDDISVRAFDLVAKVTGTVSNRLPKLSVFAKGGVAYMNTSIFQIQRFYEPTFGFGVQYNVRPGWDMHLAYTGYMGHTYSFFRTDYSYAPNVYFVGAGIDYKFANSAL